MEATYAPEQESKYIDLPTSTMDDFELDATKVCAINDPDNCEACQ